MPSTKTSVTATSAPIIIVPFSLLLRLQNLLQVEPSPCPYMEHAYPVCQLCYALLISRLSRHSHLYYSGNQPQRITSGFSRLAFAGKAVTIPFSSLLNVTHFAVTYRTHLLCFYSHSICVVLCVSLYPSIKRACVGSNGRLPFCR